MGFRKIFLILFFLVLISGVTGATTLTVDDDAGKDYTTIQAAIDAATAGDTVLIYPGAYTENIVISKQLTIEGESGNSEDIIIKTAGATNTIEITSANVTLKHISTNENSIVNGIGLKITSANDCIIEDCAFKRNMYTGLSNYNSYRTIIKNCYFVGYPPATSGVCLLITAPATTRTAYNVEVSNCTMWDAQTNLKLSFANNNTIKDCYIQNGLNFYGGSYNILTQNIFAPQTAKYFHFESATDNLIYNNIFLFNSASINYNTAGTCTNNLFSLPATIEGAGIAGNSLIGGNIWTTESFTDADNDGFSDSGYTASADLNAIDNFPVIFNTSTAETGSIISPTWISPTSTTVTWNACTDPLFEKFVLYRGKYNTGKTNYNIFETTSNTITAFTDSYPEMFPGRRDYYTLETRYTNGTSYFSSAECWSIHHTKKYYWVEGDSISTINPYVCSPDLGWAEQLQSNYLSSYGWTQNNSAVSGKTVATSLSTYQTYSQRYDGELVIDQIGINDYIKLSRDVNLTYADVKWECNYSAVRGSNVYWMLLLPKFDQTAFQSAFNWMAIANHPPNVTIVNTYDSIDSIIENGNFDEYNNTLECQDAVRVHPNTAGGKLIADKIFLLLCVDGSITNETYHPQGPETTKPVIIGKSPKYSLVTYDGSTTNFNATLATASDCAWYVNGVFLNMDFNTTTPDLPLTVKSNEYTVSMRAMNPANHSAYNEYEWTMTDKRGYQDAGTFFSKLMNILSRFFFQRVSMRLV